MKWLALSFQSVNELNVAWLGHMGTMISIDIALGIGLSPESTKPLPHMSMRSLGPNLSES